MTQDEYEFQVRQVEMRERSRYTGLAKRLRWGIGLELDGIEDFLPYLPPELVPGIKERLARARKILEEEQM